MGPDDQLQRAHLEPEVRLHQVCLHQSEPRCRQDSACQQGASAPLLTVHATEAASSDAQYDAIGGCLSITKPDKHAYAVLAAVPSWRPARIVAIVHETAIEWLRAAHARHACIQSVEECSNATECS